jgi:hypothetical protein
MAIENLTKAHYIYPGCFLWMIATLATKEIPKINTGRGLEMGFFFFFKCQAGRFAVI